VKFVLVLIIFFAGENNPTLYKYTYLDFIDENTCLLFKEKQERLLKETITQQFKDRDIEYQETVCWSQEEWLEYYKTLNGIGA
jgi:hypothetical protein